MKRIASLPSLTVLFVALFVSISLSAQTSADTIMADAQSFSFVSDSTHAEVSKALADSAYSAGEYATAIDFYERLLTDGESAVLYYNLGNAYYKIDDMSHAILNYERALRLDPSDNDVRFNLDLARSKTIDRVNDRMEIFFVRWFRSLTNLLSLDGWARVAISTFLLFLSAIALFVFGRKRSLRKTSFILAVVLLLLTFCANGIAYGQKRRLSNRTEAIVMDPSVVVHSTPSTSGTELFILHEGRKVTITDNAMQAWKQIALEDGNVGWIESKSLTVI